MENSVSRTSRNRAQRLTMRLTFKLTLITLIISFTGIVLHVLLTFSIPASFSYQLSQNYTATPGFIEVEKGTLTHGKSRRADTSFVHFAGAHLNFY